MKVFNLIRRITFKVLLLLFFLFGPSFVYSQCPTIVNPNQSFCDIDTPTVANLVAIDNGGGVKWYNSPTSPTAISSSTALLSGTYTYYVDDNSGTCGVRQPVNITVYGAPAVPQIQGICFLGTVADLLTSGISNIEWYDSPIGGSPLSPSTLLVDNSIYYAGQVNPDTGCRTSRLPALVYVRLVPTPTGSSIQKFCFNSSTPPTVANLDATGNNNWYSTPTLGTPLPLTTTLVNGTTYYATTVNLPCESSTRFPVVVEIVNPGDAGNSVTKNICQSLSAPLNIDLFNELGGTPDTTGTWSGPLTTSNGHIGSVDISSLTSSSGPYVFTYIVTSDTCPTATSTVTLNILPLPTVLITANPLLICNGENSIVTFTGTPNATVTYTINNVINETITLNSFGTATINDSYSSSTTFTLVDVESDSNPICTQSITGSTTIVVMPTPTVTIGTNATICSGATVPVTFTGTPNTVVTYIAPDGSTQTIALDNSGVAQIVIPYTTEQTPTTYTYTLVSVGYPNSPNCTQPKNASITITVLPIPTVSITSNPSTICNGSSATVTFTGTANTLVTYTDPTGATQTINLPSSGIATIVDNYTAVGSVTNYTFTLVNAAFPEPTSCIQPITGSTTIVVMPTPTVTIGTSATICSGATVPVTFTGTPNTVVTYIAPDGSTQTIALDNSGLAQIVIPYTTGQTPTTYTYTLVSVGYPNSPNCTQPKNASITITVLPIPTVSITSNPSTICNGSSATVTFTGTANTLVTYTDPTGATQTINLPSSGIATIVDNYTAVGSVTNYTFTLVSAAFPEPTSCIQPITGSATIVVLPTPTVTIGTSATICSGATVPVTFTGTPNTVVTYIAPDGSTQTIALDNSGVAQIVIPYTTEQTPTTYTYTLVSVGYPNSPNCTQPKNASITITVLPIPTVSITSNPSTICNGSSATVTFTGTANTLVTYTDPTGATQTINLPSSGIATIVDNYTAVGSVTNYTFTLVSAAFPEPTSCIQPIAGSATIVVLPTPTVTIGTSATICSGATVPVTFTGTPNTVVTYIAPDGSTQTIALDNSGLAQIAIPYTTGQTPSTFTYTLVSVGYPNSPNCTQPKNASITITVLPIPTVSITSNPSTICNGSSATVTFTGTANTLVTYTDPTGATQTINLPSSGIATIVDNYTAVGSVTNYTFTLVNAAFPEPTSCIQPITGSTTIVVMPTPTVTIGTSATICSGATVPVTFTGTPNTVVTYIAPDGSTQTIALDNSGLAQIVIPYTTGQTPTTYTYTLVSVGYPNSPNCTQPKNASITITVLPIPTVSITSNPSTICNGSSATVTFTGTANTLVTYTDPTGATQTINLPSSGIATIVDNYTAVGSVTNYTFTLVSAAFPEPTSCIQPITGSTTIVVMPTPTVTIGTNATICSGATVPVTFTGTPNTVVTYIAPDGSTQTIALDNSGLAQIAIPYTAGQTPSTFTYTLVSVGYPSSPNCTQLKTGTITLTVIPSANAGNDAVLSLCNSSSPINLFALLGINAQSGGSWNPPLQSGSNIFNPAVGGDAAGVYAYTITGNFPCSDDTATVTITLNQIPNAGNDNSTNLCSSGGAFDLFTLLGPNAQLGGTWNPPLQSGTGFFNPATGGDSAGIYTYTVGLSPCATDSSIVSVSITQAPNSGGVGVTLNVCMTSTSVDLFTGLDGNQGVGTWSDTDSTGALIGNIFNPSLVGSGTYHFTYTVLPSNPVCPPSTTIVTVVVVPIANTGVSTGAQIVCSSVGTFDLFALLTGNQSGGVWTNGSGQVITNPISVASLSGIYNFTYTITNACNTDSESVQLTVNQNPVITNANVSVLSPICKGQNQTVTISGLPDGNYIISYSINGSNILNSQTALITVVGGMSSFVIDAVTIPNAGLNTISFLNIQNSATNCSTVLIGVSSNFIISPGINNSNIIMSNICLGTNGTLLISNAVGLPDGTYQFAYSLTNGTPQIGNIANVTISNGAGILTVPSSVLSIVGINTITITSITNLTSGCSNPNESANTSFEVLPLPNVVVGTVLVNEACSNVSNEVFISNATNLANGNYTVNYQLSGANTASGSSTVSITNGAGSFFIPANQLLNGGAVTIAISQIITSTTICGSSGATFAPFTFNVIKLTTPTIISNGNEFCAYDNPTIADLSANVSGPVVWYNSSTNGTPYSSTDLLQNGLTYYATFTSTSGCQSDVRLEVKVDLTVCDEVVIPDGFSPNGDGVNDEFVIRNLTIAYPNYTLEIFNRYGNVLYKGNINTSNWDGTSTESGIKLDNNLAPVGVYFYILNYNDGVKEPKQGRLYLSR